MANMSYCRFQNTVQDMHDCFNAMAEAVDLNESMDLSNDEQRSFQEMYNLMSDMINMMEEVTQMEEQLAEEADNQPA
jgi:hypothetical protein